jgi:hypothetical protein
LNDYSGIITLHQRDYELASDIRNRLNERYGDNVASAISAQTVEFRVSPDYQRRREWFVAMLAATYMDQTPELSRARAEWFAGRLASGQDAERSEIVLEALGRECLDALAPLLDSTDEQIRLRAARVMLALRDDRALVVLRQIALDPASAYRVEAMEAVTVSARRNDATALLRLLLRDPDMRIVIAAYERLRDMGDMAIAQDFIGRSFYLEHVVQTNHKAIYVSRRGDPRIVIFGAPLTCRDNAFVESPGGAVMIDARPGQGYMTLVRKNPMRPGVVRPIRTGFVLSEVIRALGTESASTGEGQVSGLGVSYAEVIALLEQMCDKGVLAAEFYSGPLPEFEQTVKK